MAGDSGAAERGRPMTPMTPMIRVTLCKSLIGRNARHRASVAGLGLRRIGASSLLADTPENRGMIKKVRYLLQVQEGVQPGADADCDKPRAAPKHP